MSRAFVKEPEGDLATEPLPARRHSDAPNYITPGGFERLKARARALHEAHARTGAAPERLGQAADLQRLGVDLAWVEERLRRAIVVEPPPAPCDRVRLGAVVRIADETGDERCYRIVGEDETGDGLLDGDLRDDDLRSDDIPAEYSAGENLPRAGHRGDVPGELPAADPHPKPATAPGTVSWTSPLGRALLGRSVGEVVRWQRPAGEVEIEILEVSYPADG